MQVCEHINYKTVIFFRQEVVRQRITINLLASHLATYSKTSVVVGGPLDNILDKKIIVNDVTFSFLPLNRTRTRSFFRNR